MNPEILASLNCPICTKHFENPLQLVVHLADEHSLCMDEIYRVLGFDKTQKIHRCLCCGKEWELSKKQYNHIQWFPNHAVGCCRSHSAKIMARVKKIGLLNSETCKKSHTRWLVINGTTSPFGSKEVQDKARAHWINDPENGTNSPYGNKKIQEKSRATMTKRYGSYSYLLTEEFLASQPSRGASAVQLRIANMLKNAGIPTSVEVLITELKVDIVIDNTNIVLEVNPTITHNSNKGFKKMLPLPKYFHYRRTKRIHNLGYRLVNIWDWTTDEEILKICKYMIANPFYKIEQINEPVAHICHKDRVDHHLAKDVINIKDYYKYNYLLVWDAGQPSLKHILTDLLQRV